MEYMGLRGLTGTLKQWEATDAEPVLQLRVICNTQGMKWQQFETRRFAPAFVWIAWRNLRAPQPAWVQRAGLCV